MVESFLVGKHKGKKQLGRPRRRWKVNIRINSEEMMWEYVDYTPIAQDWKQCRTLVNTVMKLHVP